MKEVKYTKDGVVIPSAWVKGWGKPVSVRRGAHMVILESPERKASRQRLGRMIRKLRRAAQELGPLTPEQVAAEVAAVRTPRARRPWYQYHRVRADVRDQPTRPDPRRRPGRAGGCCDERGHLRLIGARAPPPAIQRYFTHTTITPAAFLADLRVQADLVIPVPSTAPIRDARDRVFLDLLTTEPPPQYFITGDQDFEASHYSGVPVISAAKFVRLLTHR
jgi:hypothetical protein